MSYITPQNKANVVNLLTELATKSLRHFPDAKKMPSLTKRAIGFSIQAFSLLGEHEKAVSLLKATGGPNNFEFNPHFTDEMDSGRINNNAEYCLRKALYAFQGMNLIANINASQRKMGRMDLGHMSSEFEGFLSRSSDKISTALGNQSSITQMANYTEDLGIKINSLADIERELRAGNINTLTKKFQEASTDSPNKDKFLNYTVNFQILQQPTFSCVVPHSEQKNTSEKKNWFNNLSTMFKKIPKYDIRSTPFY